MRAQFKKFKELTGKNGADLAESNEYTRQYISLLINKPTMQNSLRIGMMMQKEILAVMEQKEKEMQMLFELHEEIGLKIGHHKEESA